MKVLILALFLGQSLSAYSQSTPVYVAPHNPAPTGHFDLKMLKSRAIQYDQFEWLWVQDSLGRNGWVLKSSALLPLDFSRRALLPQGEPIHHQPKSVHGRPNSLDKPQIVVLVKRHQDWYKIIYKKKDQKYFGWVRSRYLRPYSKDSGFYFAKKESYLRQQPQMKSQILKAVPAGVPIIPLKNDNGWAYVKYGKVKGYIPLSKVKSRLDVALKVRTDDGYFKPHPKLYEHKVLEIFSNPLWVGSGAYSMELKAKPNMSSETVAQIKPWENLVVQGYSIKKWGKSHISHWGELWWPVSTIESNVEMLEDLSPKQVKLRISEIYQIEKSPISKHLRFASAPNGIYRSLDGKLWTAIGDFKSAYPIKVTKNGTLFVGDKVSFDHGESFQNFVRWDLVFRSLPNRQSLSQGPIQVINVEPHRLNPNQVTMSLKVGSNKYLQIYTPNMGKSWRLQ